MRDPLGDRWNHRALQRFRRVARRVIESWELQESTFWSLRCSLRCRSRFAICRSSLPQYKSRTHDIALNSAVQSNSLDHHQRLRLG